MYLTGWLIALAILLFWAVGAYNRLVRMRSAAIQAFGALDAELLRRTALLGEYDAVVSGPRLPQDAQMHDALRASGTQYAASLAVLRAHPLDVNAATALKAAAKVLEAAWNALVQASQQPPAGEQDSEDKRIQPSTEALASLIERCEMQHTQIDHSTRQFNKAVELYNRAVTQFPASMLASVFGFKPAHML
ncbi:LemA family protein [Diaphorobacter sp.]|uniref:LemA family protein n=1 Tax=Diaphorobacter sp. TaxID=1934310 RepID=UPI0028B1764E|nr:LemA family protein [Diaphorobacter sp.]